MGEFVLVDPLGVARAYSASKVGFSPVSGSEKVVFQEGGGTEKDDLAEMCNGTISYCDNSAATGIPNWMFASQSNLVSVSFPNVVGISYGAFSDCKSLTDVYFPKCKSIGANAFNLSPLSSATEFPECTYVDSSAFSRSAGFMANGGQYIGDILVRGAGTSSLGFTFLPSTRLIAGCAFLSTNAGELFNTNSVQMINGNAFMHAKYLRSVAFPSCSVIGAYAFQGCVSLSAASFPLISALIDYQFSGCTHLGEVFLPNCSVISWGAFSGCSTLSSVFAPNLKSVGYMAFAGCTALPSEGGAYYVNNIAVLASKSMSEIALRSGTWSLADYLFSNAKSVMTVTGTDELKGIGYGAFSNAGILSFSAPMCEFVGDYAFSYASSLSYVYLPMVSSIPSGAFYRCYKLNTVICDFDNMEYIGYGAFNGCTSLTVSLSLPACKTIERTAFYGAGITGIRAPMAELHYGTETYTVRTFGDCRKLSTVYLPNAKSIIEECFASCYSLRRVFLSNCTKITADAFRGVTNMSSLYLAGSSFCSILVYLTTSSLWSSYWAKSIYVRESLYQDYINDSMWGYFSSRIVSMTEEQLNAVAATF